MAFESKYDLKVWIIRDYKIEEMTFGEYLEEFWNDETTTPEGVANRTQVRAMIIGNNGELLDYDRYEDNLDVKKYKKEGGRLKYGTFTWSGAHGSGPLRWNGDVYDTYEEAYESILDGFLYRFHKGGFYNVPLPFFDYEDAREALDDMVKEL